MLSLFTDILTRVAGIVAVGSIDSFHCKDKICLFFSMGKVSVKIRQRNPVRVERVCHVTHREQARIIVDYNPDTWKIDIYHPVTRENGNVPYSMTGD